MGEVRDSWMKGGTDGWREGQVNGGREGQMEGGRESVGDSCKKCFRMADGEGVRNGTLERLCDTSGQWIGPLPVCEGRHNSTCVYRIE